MNHTTRMRANRCPRDDATGVSGNVHHGKNQHWEWPTLRLAGEYSHARKLPPLGSVGAVNRFADSRWAIFAGVCTLLQNRLQPEQVLRVSVARAYRCIDLSSDAQPDGPPLRSCPRRRIHSRKQAHERNSRRAETRTEVERNQPRKQATA